MRTDTYDSLEELAQLHALELALFSDKSHPVDGVRSDIHTPDGVGIDIEDSSKVAFDAHGVNRLPVGCGEFVDFMGAKPGIKRIFFEYSECCPGAAFLVGRKFGKSPPKRFCSVELVAHSS